MFNGPKFNEAGPKNPVIDVLCLWEPAEGRGLDNLPTRGFAVQMLFLTRGSAEPAQVDGAVRVYLFDDQGTEEEQSKPLHQFDFAKEAFGKYLTETNFGAAYQLFIPYTRKGSHEANCGLRVRYTPADGGPPVYSKMADVVLPGAKPKTSSQRWNPEHRQLRADALDRTGVPPAADGVDDEISRLLSAEPEQLNRTASIPMPANVRAVQARSRLKKLAAQMANAQEHREGEQIHQAVFETEQPPAPPTRRFQLHRDER